MPFDSPSHESTDLFLDHTRKISISGVQVKYSLRLEGDQLQLTDQGGQYLLKPVPVGQFKHLDQAPANEHLTMQIARQVYQLNIPANALIFFRDGSPAYLVKRFDQKPEGGRFLQEDFAQIAQITSESHGLHYKYDLSYEALGKLIRQYIPAYRIEVEKFLRLILFNYIFSNGDAHVKNFSAIQTVQGDYVLTPAYDLLCTRIHSPNESDMALSLFEEFSKAYEAYGFYTYEDFYLFGQGLGIKPSRVEKIIGAFAEEKPLVKAIIDRSFLKEEIKEEYLRLYRDKLTRLELKFEEPVDKSMK
ncbi:HipA domain-containing protein [Nafulsella turpanensis]|uniref:HipA domain-containing protein n=1 Tax=Nafulsella turpanensis TaxID=1265690 RepID=UPI001F25F473|nr:HipA domain-containing protein [Nafulsella turpanensis]